MSNKTKLKEGQTVTIKIPFSYEIGQEGPVTGKILKTIEDCEDEVRAELDNFSLNGGNAFLEFGSVE